MHADDENDVYEESRSRRAKRRKTNTGKATPRATRAATSLSGLLDVFQHGLSIRAQPPPSDGTRETGDNNGHETENGSNKDGFEATMEGFLPEYLDARKALWIRSAEAALSEDNKGIGIGEGENELLRSLSRFEVARIVALAKQRLARMPSPHQLLALRKLQLQQERRRAGIKESHSVEVGTPSTLTPLDIPSSTPIPHAVLDALKEIYTTPYENSFAARIYGHTPQKTPGLVAIDWESRPPWTLLMDDVHAHYALAHPERDQPETKSIPIIYVSLQPSHLRQVHDLLTRVFWEGINVSDALQYAPERCTVIAMYGHLVVGAAFLSSPQETYITYLAVRAGWENAQIATTMLYHLIAFHPHRDITLHVSVNSPAMLLYNRFGFKAEEFIAGFYEAYLDSHSRASKNAFRLRLRR